MTFHDPLLVDPFRRKTPIDFSLPTLFSTFRFEIPICSAIAAQVRKKCLLIYLLNDPSVYLSSFLVEVYTNKENLFAGIHIASIVVAVFDLIHRNFCGLIEFELEYKHEVIIRCNGINSTIVCF